METPLVICVGQRPGPATGLPTWTCQSDLQFIIRAGHGEIPRVVLTPSNTHEHFELTRFAFQLAEKYQVVVFILSDKFALESLMSMPRPDDVYQNERLSFAPEVLPEDNSYRRFEVTEEGYSPRSIPGQPHGLSVTNSYEHDEFGYATESGEMTKIMNEKRERKIKGIAREIPQPELIGPAKADITYVSWGSTRVVLEDVVKQLSTGKEKFTANLIHIPCAWPFPKDTFFHLAASSENLVMVEANITGQMEDLIKQETGLNFHHHIRRYDGRPFYASDIIEQTRTFLEEGTNH
jgi:2-oxoglutarate ferredoxin oxidoreductase subunit alpha